MSPTIHFLYNSLTIGLLITDAHIMIEKLNKRVPLSMTLSSVSVGVAIGVAIGVAQ